MLAVADDLTGAAEIAAIGHRAGWRTEVVTHGHHFGDSDLTVIDTDTRLAAPAVAAQKLATVGTEAVNKAWDLIYKKTDSVLRGPVLAEVTALAGALQRKVVLLVPSNPSLGRVTRGGRYFVHAVPLDQTTFARDPHHPARTAVVAELLGRPGDVNVLPTGATIPSSGVVVGEAATPDDVRRWAAQVNERVLPAGGGEFFTTLLQRHVGRGPSVTDDFSPAKPTLLICGSTAAPRQADGVIPLPSDLLAKEDAFAINQWVAAVVAALVARPFVAVRPPPERSSDPRTPGRIRDALVLLAQRALEARACRHLMIEGGATASSILAALGWTQLAVAREWAQGVVTLRPAVDKVNCVTMKPGSYHWPDSLWTHVGAPA